MDAISRKAVQSSAYKDSCGMGEIVASDVGLTLRKRKIALISSDSSLQTGLLARLIGEQLGMRCDVLREDTSANRLPQQLLIDCQGQTQLQLSRVIDKMQRWLERPSIALLNAQVGCQVERLIEWPCICAIFYSNTDQENLIKGLRSWLRGEYWFPRPLLHAFLQKHRRHQKSAYQAVLLTKRESQILSQIADGNTNAAIAQNLFLSEHTIKSHLYKIYKKLDVRNRLEACNWARQYLPSDETINE